MEVVGTIVKLMGCINKVVNMVEKTTNRAVLLRSNLRTIKRQLQIIVGEPMERNQLQLSPIQQIQLQELAYDIEDFVQGLWDPGEVGSFILSSIGADPRLETIQRTKDFKVRIEKLQQELKDCSEGNPSGGTSTPAGLSSSAGSPISYFPDVGTVGMKRPKMEIKELLSRRVEPHRGTLGVVTIVGRSGSGKTALARELYEDKEVTEDFDVIVWVVESDNSSDADILNKILQELRLPSLPEDKRYLVFVDDVRRGTTCQNIKNAFHGNAKDSRIIVTTSIPSIAMDCSSGSFLYTLRGLDKEKSRKLFRRVFRGKGRYSEEDKYRMENKDVDVIVDKCDGLPVALISAAECLRGKSRKNGNMENPTSGEYTEVSKEIGENLACSESDIELYKRNNVNATTLVEMRRAVVEPYENLLGNGDKNCLLYVSIFPGGHQIDKKSLVRRLIAEGFDPGDPFVESGSESVVISVRKCLRTLIDHRMIEPVPIHSYSAAKRCQVHSIMLEFTIKKAVSRNLVSLIHKDKAMYNKCGEVRRLTVQSSECVGLTGPPSGIGLTVLRSLAIFESGIMNLQECKLVRVLDLEGCHGLTSEVLGNICRLLFLKYLSLRKTDIQNLPREVKNLRCLEILDTRETVVIKLPVEVIMLPRFAYLFGQFELTNVKKNTEELRKFFSGKKSQLHTLGGISVDVTQVLEIVLLVIEHATELKKVKVWYRNTPRSKGKLNVLRKKLNMFGLSDKMKRTAGPSAVPSSNTPDQAPATSTPVASDTPELIHCVSTFAETLKKPPLTLESLSIDFNGVSNTFLDFLQINRTISSIKLRRVQGSLPGPDKLGQVCNLKKLHLFSTGIESKELATLQHLKCLQYLKLAEEGPGLWDSVFHVQVGGFISLMWLCFESSNSLHPRLMIDEGVKIPLASLLLLCEESEGPQTGTPVATIGPQIPIEQVHVVRDISCMPNLNEVILHKEVSTKIVNAWKEEAKKHINRPYVEKKQD